MTDIKQRIVVTTIEDGEPVSTDYVADSYQIIGGEYVLAYQGQEVARINVDDVIQGDDNNDNEDATGGIRTVFSRS